MNRSNKFITFLSLLSLISSFYTPHYRKCRLNAPPPPSQPIQQLQYEKIPIYNSTYYFTPINSTYKPLQYKKLNYFYLQFIGSGSSGEVYLVEDQQTHQGKIVKRFFKERSNTFMLENYIMSRMGYKVQWDKDCGDEQCGENSSNHTMAIFPQLESMTIRELQFSESEAPLILYKTIYQLNRLHKEGIIHDDIKMGNILVNLIPPSLKMLKMQLIDWNLANPYYIGYLNSIRGGTTCYYSPQEMMKTHHLTPAVDIWALGVVMWTYFTDKKPFYSNCKSCNFKAIISLVGGERVLEVFQKYRHNVPQFIKLLTAIKENPSKYPKRSLQDKVPSTLKKTFTPQLLAVFQRMFEVDPEKRATAEQLLQMDYFKQIMKLPPIHQKATLNRLKKKKKEQGVPDDSKPQSQREISYI